MNPLRRALLAARMVVALGGAPSRPAARVWRGRFGGLCADRMRACLVAGALGDALGGPYEGSEPDPTRELAQGPLTVSDDTQLTLATCRAIARSEGIAPASIAEEFARAYESGLRGVGSSTLGALRALRDGVHWSVAGARGEFSAGNGGAMRVAPLAFFGDVASPEYLRVVRDVVRITHHNDEAIEAALAVLRAMQQTGAPEPTRRARLLAVAAGLDDTLVRDRVRALADPSVTAPEHAARVTGTSGRAASSVPLALFLALDPNTIWVETTRSALRLGGDTDTTASITGSVLAALGRPIPDAYAERLDCRNEIHEICAALAPLLLYDR